ncbi:MAG: polyprenol monophosphomannose synthase [Polyangia bacterium]|nr:polyprenol monophosphomannose synthase [Polyangia bacterium]
MLEAISGSLPGAHVLVIDDASKDGTGLVADELASARDWLFVHHREGKLGLGTAYRWGFGWALERPYEHVFEMDCDFSHDPRDLPRLLERSRRGADLVIGSRYVPGGGTDNWTWGRRAMSRGGGAYSRLVLGVSVRDLTAGFRCFRRRTLELLGPESLRAEGFAFQIEVTYRVARAGLTIVEVPVIFRDRVRGESKMSGGIFLEALLAVWRIRLGL